MELVYSLLGKLSQEGRGYYWVKAPDGAKVTTWWEPGQIPDLPAEGDIYFGVHPAKAIPVRKNKEGKVIHPKFLRATLEDIAAISCLFAEFDSHEEDGKGNLFERIKSIHPTPSVLVDSGGGYHAYWLLYHPVPIKDKKDQFQMADIQARWVAMMGGDQNAKDLARVLRVPGTYNYKYDPPKEVVIVWSDMDCMYELAELAALLPKVDPPGDVVIHPAAPAPGGKNGSRWLDQAIQKRQPGTSDATGFWLARQCQADGLSEGDVEEILLNYQHAVRGMDSHSGYTEKDALRNVHSAFKSPPLEPAKSRTPRVTPAPRVNGNGHHPEPTAAPAPMMEAVLEMPEEPPPLEGTTSAPPKIAMLASAENSLPAAVKIELDRVEQCFRMNEVGDADLMTDLFRDQVVYDHAEKRWYIWRGHYWERDRTGYIYQLISRRVAPHYLDLSAEMTRRDADAKLIKSMIDRASQLRSKKRMEAVLDLASKNFGMGLTGDEWDKDPWMLGCPNGVVDLRTGDFRAGKPGDYIRSKCVTEWHGLYAECATWIEFMNQVFGEKFEIVSFMARMLGYGITGLSVEHLFPILWGEGGNGKGTMLETLAKVLGPEITSPSNSEALMAKSQPGSGPQPFLYDLRGKRLVWASESGEGRRIDEGLVKQLTGGDRLKVRTLYTEAVEFDPTHLIMLLTNHKPHINADGRAIWRRVVLIPFEEAFVENPTKEHEHKQDPFLKEKLLKEAPGILAWLVQGCLDWQERRLQPPDEVIAATAAYREEEDVIGHFLAERCVVRPFALTKSSILYSAYSTWAKDGGMTPMSLMAFGQRIRKRFPARESHGIWYDGLAIQN